MAPQTPLGRVITGYGNNGEDCSFELAPIITIL